MLTAARSRPPPPPPQISDAILDACLEQDPDARVGAHRLMSGGSHPALEWNRAAADSRGADLAARLPCGVHVASSRPTHHPTAARRPQVACETCTKTNMVMVFGEITTTAKVDYEAVVRKTCREVGFVSADVGLDCDKCKVGGTQSACKRARAPCKRARAQGASACMHACRGTHAQHTIRHFIRPSHWRAPLLAHFARTLGSTAAPAHTQKCVRVCLRSHTRGEAESSCPLTFGKDTLPSLARPPAVCAQVLVHIEEQSPEIGQSVHGMGTKALEDIGAGDQVRCGHVCCLSRWRQLL